MGIRKANQQDLQLILSHSPIVMKEATVGYYSSYHKAVQFMNYLLDSGGYYLVYELDGRIQGWIALGTNYNYYYDQMEGMIAELYVLPPYRNNGIAKKLCEEAVKQLKSSGYQKVQLNVFAGNNAKRLYKKLGFHEVSTLMEKNLY